MVGMVGAEEQKRKGADILSLGSSPRFDMDSDVDGDVDVDVDVDGIAAFVAGRSPVLMAGCLALSWQGGERVRVRVRVGVRVVHRG